MRPAPRAGPVLLGAGALSRADARDRGPLLRRLERQLHHGFARGSEVLEVGDGAFRLYLWPRPEPFYRNRALPVAPPPAWGPAVASLLAAFARARREPRLEFFAELWPGLPPALEAAGLRREAEAPVLALAGPPAAAGGAAAVRLLDGTAPPALVGAFLAAAQAAFGAAAVLPDPDELAQLRRDLADGATLAAAWMEGGAPVAGACLIGLGGGGGEAELAAVWTSRDRRRRGLAGAVCATLLRTFLARGGELAWLSAGGEGSEGLYRKLGFTRVGTQLDYAGPAAPAA